MKIVYDVNRGRVVRRRTRLVIPQRALTPLYLSYAALRNIDEVVS